MKNTPLTDNVFDALEKYGQCALTGPSGPVQGISNPSNGVWRLRPELKKVNDVEIYTSGLFQINNDATFDETIKSLNEQYEPWGIPHSTLYKFKNEVEFNDIVNKALRPISICTFGGE